MLQAWARLCKCLGQDFLPYMSVVMPPLLQSAQLKPDVTITSADSDNEIEESDDERFVVISPCSLFVLIGICINWCGVEALCNRFPNLFNLATNREAKVADMWDIREGDGCWSPTFLRSLNDRELEKMTRFLQILHDHKFRPTGVDKLTLKNAMDKGFSVKSMYKGFDVSPALDFPHRMVWNPVVPPKIGVFAWEVVWGKMLTLDQLKRRGMTFANRCFMCEEEEETIDHLLIHCKLAKMLWDLILSIVGISWVFPQSVLHTLLAWQGAAVGKKRKKSGWQPRCACFGISGALEIGWCLR